MSEIVDKKQKDYLIDIFQKEGMQACLDKANSPAEIKTCESFIKHHKTGKEIYPVYHSTLHDFDKFDGDKGTFTTDPKGEGRFHISEKPYLTYIKKGTSFAPSIEQCLLGMWEETIEERTLYIYINPNPEKTIPPYRVWDTEITEERISTVSVPAIKVGEVKIVNKKLLDDIKREYYSEHLHKYDKLDSFTVKEHWYQELYKHGTLFDIIWY